MEKLIQQASEIHEKLEPFTRDGRAHFRPTSSGVTLVGLLPDRPQRGKGGYRAQWPCEYLPPGTVLWLTNLRCRFLRKSPQSQLCQVALRQTIQRAT